MRCCPSTAPEVGVVRFFGLEKNGSTTLQEKINTTKRSKVWVISLLQQTLIPGQLSVLDTAKSIAWRTITSRITQQKSFAGDRQPSAVPI